jgi:transposase-like protein
MAEEATRRFSREFKVAAVRRMLAGENVSALARELGVRRKYLYQWRDRFRLGGAIALRSRGRPTKAEVLAMRPSGGEGPSAEDGSSAAPMRPAVPPDALTTAQRRIAALERKIGQQQVDLDFFQQALRHVRGLRQRSGAPGGTASTRSSKR